MITFIESNKLQDEQYLAEQAIGFYNLLLDTCPQTFFNALLSALDEYKNKKGFVAVTPNVNAKFDEFYSLYPRKVGKPAALKAFNKIKPTPVVYNKILEGLAKYKLHWKKQGTKLEFIPHPSTWLNQRRWEDDIPVTLPQFSEMDRIIG